MVAASQLADEASQLAGELELGVDGGILNVEFGVIFYASTGRVCLDP